MENKKIRVCAYCRVSTRKGEQSSSIDNQEDYFVYTLEKNPDFEFVGVYADKLSGTKLSRPQFDKMLIDAGLDIQTVVNDDNDTRKDRIKYTPIPSTSRKPKFDRIYVKDASRFARNVKVEDILDGLLAKKVYVYFDDFGASTENEADRERLRTYFNGAEWESRAKSRNVRMGFDMGIMKGIIHTSSVLYGYEYIKGDTKQDNRLKVIDEEADVIRKIFEMYSQGLGFRRIRETLTSEGIYTRQGKPFGNTTIRNIIDNEKYAGFDNRGKYDTGKLFAKNTYAKRKSEYQVRKSDKIPAIIHEDLFYKCREILKGKVNFEKNVGLYNPSTKYGGLLVCGVCGAKYYSNKDVDRYFYNCSNKKKFGTSKCDNVNVSYKSIDEYFEYLLDGGYKHKVCLKIVEQENKLKNLKLALAGLYNTDKIDDVEKLKLELIDLEGQHNRATDLYISGKVTDKNKIEESISKIEHKQKEAQEELHELTRNNKSYIQDIFKIEELIHELRQIEQGTHRDDFTMEEIIQSIGNIKVKKRKDGTVDLNNVTFKLEKEVKVIMEKYKASSTLKRIAKELMTRDFVKERKILEGILSRQITD
jgi:site-specific DNA recombinase